MPGPVHQPDPLVGATVAVLGPGSLLHDPGLGRGHSGVHVRELLTVAPAGHAQDGEPGQDLL